MQVGSRRAVLNPASGHGNHAELVERLLSARGFDVSRTEDPGDALELGRAAGKAGAAEVAVVGRKERPGGRLERRPVTGQQLSEPFSGGHQSRVRRIPTNVCWIPAATLAAVICPYSADVLS